MKKNYNLLLSEILRLKNSSNTLFKSLLKNARPLNLPLFCYNGGKESLVNTIVGDVQMNWISYFAENPSDTPDKVFSAINDLSQNGFVNIGVNRDNTDFEITIPFRNFYPLPVVDLSISNVDGRYYLNYTEKNRGFYYPYCKGKNVIQRQSACKDDISKILRVGLKDFSEYEIEFERFYTEIDSSNSFMRCELFPFNIQNELALWIERRNELDELFDDEFSFSSSVLKLKLTSQFVLSKNKFNNN